MAFIKTSNNITVEETTEHIKIVQCPYCKTYARDVPKYVTAMKCWHCDKEFRIQQDKDRHYSDYKKPGNMTRTALGRIG